MIPEEDAVDLNEYTEYPYAEDIKVAFKLYEETKIGHDVLRQLISKWLDRFGVKP